MTTNLKLVPGKTYDIVNNSGILFPSLRYLETVSLQGKICMTFVNEENQTQIHNLSYMATIMEVLEPQQEED